MALNFRYSIVLLVSLFLAVRTCAYPILEEPTDSLVNLTARQDDVNPLAFHFINWAGCQEPQKQTVNNAWDELMTIGKAVNHDIDWDSEQAKDFLGYKSNNAKHQHYIQAVMKNIVTWDKSGTFLSWQLEVRCDDYLRQVHNVCPKGTKPEDEDKCGSRCWVAKMKTDPEFPKKKIVDYWRHGAAAYTTSQTAVNVGTINFCPAFFSMDSCKTKMDRAQKEPEGSDYRLNLNNYQCLGYAALHELMHIDNNVRRVTGWTKDVPHVTDRTIKINNGPATTVDVKAYGPQYCKTLARWTIDTGFWVISNADNLAQYALAIWATSGAGAYPYLPERKDTDRPVQRPWLAGTENDNGVITLSNNATVLGAALNVAPEDAYDTYISEPYDCSDATNASIIDLCTDATVNPPIDLVARPQGSNPSTSTVAPAPTTNAPTTNAPTTNAPTTNAPTTSVPTTSVPLTSAPAPAPTVTQPADFNCNCGESSCSHDSMPCCANGSCKCQGTAEDPTCCASGTCAPLPARMLKRI